MRVKLLIQGGANLRLKDKHCEKSNTARDQHLRALLSKHADFHTLGEECYCRGFTVAQMVARLTAARLLINGGADVRTKANVTKL